MPAYLLPQDVDAITFRSADWVRQTLFDSRRGSIGLAWSIFKLRGTPNEANWPVRVHSLFIGPDTNTFIEIVLSQLFEDLPDANKIQFKVVPCREIRASLPNLPPDVPTTGSEHRPPKDSKPTPLDLIHRLLVYPPEDRLKAAAALKHPWFTGSGDVPLLVRPENRDRDECNSKAEWKGKSLEDWFQTALGGR